MRLLPLLALAAVATAAEPRYETLTLNDGRVLTGLYDPDRGFLDLFAKGSTIVPIAPGDIASRKAAEPPKPDPTEVAAAEAKQAAERKARIDAEAKAEADAKLKVAAETKAAADAAKAAAEKKPPKSKEAEARDEAQRGKERDLAEVEAKLAKIRLRAKSGAEAFLESERTENRAYGGGKSHDLTAVLNQQLTTAVTHSTNAAVLAAVAEAEQETVICNKYRAALGHRTEPTDHQAVVAAILNAKP